MKTVDERLCDIGNVIGNAAFERDYLDRVALEAMKVLLAKEATIFGCVAEAPGIAGDSYTIARAMLKARSQS